MKKKLISLLLGIGVTCSAQADDLMTVYMMAVENDPLINRAEAQKDAAYAGINLSRASLLPQIAASISYTDSTREFVSRQQLGGGDFIDVGGDVDVESKNFGIDLSMSLYDHANWLNYDRAELVAQQSDAVLASTNTSSSAAVPCRS